jgi:hypothetical protein
MVTMDSWEPITDAGGAVLGWMQAADPDEPDVDYFEADRLPRIRRRADVIGPAAALTADEAFSADEVRVMWQRSGLSDADLDAAANVAFELWKIEQGRR